MQAADFSPKGTFLTTWQRPSKEAGATPNLKLFEVATGKMVAAYHMKNPAVPGVSWPAVEWSADEKFALRIATNTVFIHRGDSGWEDGNVLERVSVEGIKQFSVSPGSSYRFTTFVPEIKGKPAKVAVYSYPNNLEAALTGKSFYQAEEVGARGGVRRATTFRCLAFLR